ncbi:MAG: hypothetical protein A2806_03815 [Candidatus Terrybacteria bacterium RIFCSPHIGHO2_01_FULL_48_17]|uniref:Cupin fold metalloprotein WbuC cupin domain-containing protein n=1 Tax=Candidatus Terrybacteria bacterium RIFCSPHIGHO2_01_FULL_48_17 TaxID=1802362 RepID=A0A1G2PJX2_9BACT|nr:MAG: hypothetical protein A2806_03815 [Candidatus Terrybacteria bacterium RIFCSPHIGHO2_01_FULL_48_17]OHA53204.1 MAG: hypothetical protein A3A30_04505 [Candidatus Terrybacteria bacterium RIFCSPLOWO2_01_FULL_48_14]
MERRSNLKIVTWEDVNALKHAARRSPRKRQNANLHEYKDVVQFFFNAFSPPTYVQPHRHVDKDEYFLICEGTVLTLEFDDAGEVTQIALLEAGVTRACKIEAGTWHTVVALTESILLEVKAGPYDPNTAKEFAAWAPSEGAAEAEQWQRKLLDTVRRANPELLLFRFLQE